MEPVTHVLTGVCLARAGFNRKTAHAVVAMAVAAELPDIDMLWTLRGPVEGLAHHRGITHTFLGLPVEAALVVGAVWVWERWKQSPGRGGREAVSQGDDSLQGTNNGNGQRRFPSHPSKQVRLPGTPASGMTTKKARATAAGDVPVRWGWLTVGVLVALLSHLLLDFTNNYGIRPFFPFDTHWFAWSIVFIFDPLIFALLLLALVAPLLFGLVGAEVGVMRQRFRGRGWAIAGLVGMVAWWGLRGVEHGRAVELAQAQTVAATQGADVNLEARRTLAAPDPWSPFQWSAVTDFGPVYRQSEVDAWRGTLESDDLLVPKPGDDAAVRAAETSALGRAYLDWSPMPYVGEVAGPDGRKTVTFRDPRFLGGWMAAHGRTSLVGTVREDARGRVVEQSLDGRVER